ncbi:DNA-directed RNA polymerase subunit omega [Microaerobacter geothermalis]|uniref:DNA-directed RNA polymerase subunit omega n=1 Tax=Microaerobacter geothermalis TaxID=674972 RepID=UPI001F281A64|nr:DNA-directed RNA polymerase subunit omega [Microaerobacter geothermalis]MCF6094881.1 DNA-directed RNA polymerase subunit omega [Microaerobacter geothermalis]
MRYPSIDVLVEKTGSKYTLVALAAKRARQLRETGKVLIEQPKSRKHVGMALEEIAFDKLTFDRKK